LDLVISIVLRKIYAIQPLLLITSTESCLFEYDNVLNPESSHYITIPFDRKMGENNHTNIISFYVEINAERRF
jgi:hypothetical protein